MRTFLEVQKKYNNVFGTNKEHLDILQECHEKLKSLRGMNFSIESFDNEETYQYNLSLIDEYRKYSEMDKFLLESDSSSLILASDARNINLKVTYHDIIEAMNIYNEKFTDSFNFYLKRTVNNIKNNFEEIKVLTINGIFNNESSVQHKLYFIESQRRYCFGILLNNYEFIYYLPFTQEQMKSENQSVVYGYLYLVNEHLHRNFEHLDKSKVYSNLEREYGAIYEDYLKEEKISKYIVYQTTLAPFLIENPNLTYYPHMDKMDLDVVSFRASKEEQHADFYKYFQTLEFDEQKSLDYVKTHWIKANDIGYVYNINFNYIGTKEEMEDYKNNIIENKFSDIKLNFQMYKQYGLLKYGDYKKRFVPKDGYKQNLLSYFDHYQTKKADFNTQNDTRISLDADIFRVGQSDWVDDKYCQDRFRHSNFTIREHDIFGEQKHGKNVPIQIDLIKFIESYNHILNDKLQIDYDWYYPQKQLYDYVGNSVRAFCKIFLTSGVKMDEFQVLKEAFFYQGEERKKILSHPNFHKERKGVLIGKHNLFYFEVPMLLETFMDRKEFEKITLGVHPIFKSEKIEQILKDKQLLLQSSERFLSKKEMIETNNFDVIYTSSTHQALGNHRALKGRVVAYDEEVVIEDELGNTHTFTFQAMKNSGWKHLNTVDEAKLYSKMQLAEKAYLQKVRKLQLESPQQTEAKYLE